MYIYSGSRNERRDAENAPGRFFAVPCDLRRESISFDAHVRLSYSLDPSYS